MFASRYFQLSPNCLTICFQCVYLACYILVRHSNNNSSPPKDLSLRNMSKPFGNTSDVMMLFSRWLSVPHTMSGWCSCSNVAKSSRFPVERRLQQFTVIIFSLCSFRLVGLGISRMSSVPVISVVPVVC